MAGANCAHAKCRRVDEAWDVRYETFGLIGRMGAKAKQTLPQLRRMLAKGEHKYNVKKLEETIRRVAGTTVPKNNGSAAEW